MRELWGYVRRHRIWQLALLLVVIFILYWSVFAARRYVSEAHIVVESLEAAASPTAALSALLPGAAAAGKDLLLLRDHLLSADMLAKLDAKLDLRAHYSDNYDVFSRLPRRDVSLEWFLDHYRERVIVQYDDYAGLLVIQAQAYNPAMARDIAVHLVQEGERFMNELAHRLAREQMAFAEREVMAAGKRVGHARQALLAYQNEHGLVSPTATVGSISGVVARLDAELSTLQARRRAMEAYLAPRAPELVQINEQMRALEQQLKVERARLASAGGRALNRVAEEYDRLLFEASFQQDMYKTALGALERARIDASRMLKKVSVLQEPTLPEYSLAPGRLYHSTLYALATLLLAAILHLLLSIVREHRD